MKLGLRRYVAQAWRTRQQLARTGWLPVRPTKLRYKGRLVGVGVRVLRQVWIVEWLPKPTRRGLELENAQLRLEKARVLALHRRTSSLMAVSCATCLQAWPCATRRAYGVGGERNA